MIPLRNSRKSRGITPSPETTAPFGRSSVTTPNTIPGTGPDSSSTMPQPDAIWRRPILNQTLAVPTGSQCTKGR
jgi:hypothetical protein